MTTHATAFDRRALVRGRTEDLEAIDRPVGEAGAPNVPLPPGRYLLVDASSGVRAIALTRHVTHLGRGFAATLQLEDPGVSRRHAIVMQRRGGVRILDDRSANGTWVNSRRVLEQDLHDGDVIVLGHAVLVYRERRAQAA